MYEYLVKSVQKEKNAPSQQIKILNKLASEGWELVTVNEGLLYLRKRKEFGPVLKYHVSDVFNVKNDSLSLTVEKNQKMKSGQWVKYYSHKFDSVLESRIKSIKDGVIYLTNGDWCNVEDVVI